MGSGLLHATRFMSYMRGVQQAAALRRNAKLARAVCLMLPFPLSSARGDFSDRCYHS